MTETSAPAEDVAAPARTIDKTLLFTGMVTIGLGQSLIFIIITPLAKEIGLTALQLGVAFTIANLAMVVTAPYWGRKSDSAGRRPVFIFGLAGCALGYLLMALTMQIGIWGWTGVWGTIFLLILSRGVFAVTTPAIYSASSGYIADITNRRNRAQGMALMGGANSFGLIIGPAMGGGLAFIAILLPVYSAAVIAALVALVTYFHLREPERHDTGSHVKLQWNDRRILPFMIMWLAFFVGFTSLQFVTAYFLADRIGITDTNEIVKVFSMASLSQATIAVVMQTIVLQRINIPQIILMRLCLPFFVTGLVTLALATTVTAFFVAYGLFGLAFSMAGPGFSGGASLSVKPHEQGAAAGFVSSATTFGVIVGPLIGTSLYTIAPTLPMWVAAAMLTALSGYALTVKVPKPQWGGAERKPGSEPVAQTLDAKEGRNAE